MVAFRGAMTIRTVEKARGDLLGLLGDGGCAEIVLDCSGVEEADVAFVQLLLAARCGAAAMGKDLRLAKPAAGALRDVLDRGGFLAATSTPDETQFWTHGR
jgi:anti-anti-sigma regulatory factor